MRERRNISEQYRAENQAGYGFGSSYYSVRRFVARLMQKTPLPFRRMIASLEVRRGEWAGFLADITWCRFTQHGWYDSGGR